MADLLFELSTAELPPRDLRDAALALERDLADRLAAAGLPAVSTRSAWTPRRIAVWAFGLADRSPDREERVKGPPLRVAFDAAGAPTRYRRKASFEIAGIKIRPRAFRRRRRPAPPKPREERVQSPRRPQLGDRALSS